MKSVFVAAGMSTPVSEKIKDEAVLLGKLLAQNKCRYIQGGFGKGMMGLTLKSFLKYSKDVVFLIPKVYFASDFPSLQSQVDGKLNVRIMEDEADRLTNIKKCNAIIVLPGGTGTLEELLYLNETSRASEHSRKIYLVNCEHFFDGLLAQIQTNIEETFTKPSAIHFKVVKSVKEIEFLNNKNDNDDDKR